ADTYTRCGYPFSLYTVDPRVSTAGTIRENCGGRRSCCRHRRGEPLNEAASIQSCHRQTGGIQQEGCPPLGVQQEGRRPVNAEAPADTAGAALRGRMERHG